MDFLADITIDVLIIGFTMATIELIKSYLNIPQAFWWILVVGFAVGYNYLFGLIGVENLLLIDAIKIGFVSSGLYGLGKPVIQSLKSSFYDG